MFPEFQLERPANINSRVSLAALPDSNALTLRDLTLCTVSGWGVTWLPSYTLSPELMSVDVNIFSNCWYYYYFRITENMICAGSLQGGKDACQVHIHLNLKHSKQPDTYRHGRTNCN